MRISNKPKFNSHHFAAGDINTHFTSTPALFKLLQNSAELLNRNMRMITCRIRIRLPVVSLFFILIHNQASAKWPSLENEESGARLIEAVMDWMMPWLWLIVLCILIGLIWWIQTLYKKTAWSSSGIPKKAGQLYKKSAAKWKKDASSQFNHTEQLFSSNLSDNPDKKRRYNHEF